MMSNKHYETIDIASAINNTSDDYPVDDSSLLVNIGGPEVSNIKRLVVFTTY